MARSTFGSLQEFQPDSESITAYLERTSVYFTANSIDAAKQVPVLLSVIGAKTYSLLRSLTAPDKPQDKSYAELSEILQAHFEPKPLLIAERFHFYRRNQADGESIAEFVAELRRLATHCEFGDQLNDALRDRLVCGLKSESAQKRLLSEAKLTLSRALEIAQGLESAEAGAKALKSPDAAIRKLSHMPRPKEDSTVSKRNGKPCFRCGRSNHDPKNCRFIDATCHNCAKKGHIAPVCRTKKTNLTRRGQKPVERKAKYVAKADETESDPEEFQLFTLGTKASRPITVDMRVEGRPLTMEVDTGAAVSIISERTKAEVLPQMQLQSSNVILKTYTDQRMSVMGQLMVKVTYGQQNKHLPLLVVQGEGPSLLGRNWLTDIKLNWKEIGTIARVEEDSLDTLLEKHKELFKDELGTIRNYQAELQLQPEARPKFFKARPVPFAIREAIENELDRLEGLGVIEKVDHSDWASPIVPVPKRDGKVRVCGDFKVTINCTLEVDKYPLPKPADLFATLAGGKKFTKLDLSQAYQQLPLEEKSRKLVTVNTHRGLFRYTRLPFGVASAPAIFQKLMDSILQGIPRVICYIDDILITGVSDQDHLQNLSLVLQQLTKHNIRVKKSKCEFLMPSVEYLGHKVTAEGLHAMESKLDAIVQAPQPRNLQELRSFLGLLNYYGKFIPNLASLLHPLNSLLQHDQPWRWTPDCEEAFQQAKQALTSSNVLVHYDPALPLTLAGDASAYGIGAVISHTMPDGTERPIAFASRTLTSSERNYAQLEKEALSLVFGVKRFHQFLYGRKFTLVTDHKPLTAIFGAKKGIPSLAAARLQRWAILLSAYPFEIRFKPTRSHANADGLSRLPLATAKEESVVCSPEPSIFNISQLEALPVTAAQIEAATRNDPILSKVLTYTRRGWPQQQHLPEALKPFQSRAQELTIEGDCLLWGIRVVIPRKLQCRVLQELHSEHPGVTRMKSLARSHVWWPGLDKQIEETAKSCTSCQSVKHAPPVAPMHPWIWPTTPWQRIHVDYAGPFQGKMYFVVVDAHSKWPEVFEMNNTSATKTITILRHLFSCYGLPNQLVSDNGPQFVSEEFSEFMKRNGIKHIRCSPYHPSSNGLVERFIQTFKQAMKAGHHEGRTSQHCLANFLLKYRTVAHATTNRSPSTLFLNRTIRTRFDLLKPQCGHRVSDKQADQVQHHDKRAKPRQMQIGQKVMARNFRSGYKWVPGVIVECLGPLTYLVEIQEGLRWKRHIDHLRDRESSTSTSDLESADADAFVTAPFSDANAETEHDSTESISPTEPTVRRYPVRTRNPPDRLM